MGEITSACTYQKDEDLTDNPRTAPGHQKSKKYYSDDFINSLAQAYDFDPTNINLLTYLYEIPYRYNVANSIQEGDREFQPQHRKNLLRLQAKFRDFKDELYEQGGDYFNQEVSYGAIASGDLAPSSSPLNWPKKEGGLCLPPVTVYA